MKLNVTRAAVFAMVVLAGVPALASNYDSTSRVATIETALRALKSDFAAAITVRETIRDRGRSRCRGSADALVLRCYLELAREVCKDSADCTSVADVVITNHLGDDSFVNDSDRYRLMNEGESFRAALDAELGRHYARLAAGLAIETKGAASAETIDAFCIDQGRSGKLPWQRCVSALVWFLASESSK